MRVKFQMSDEVYISGVKRGIHIRCQMRYAFPVSDKFQLSDVMYISGVNVNKLGPSSFSMSTKYCSVSSS